MPVSAIRGAAHGTRSGMCAGGGDGGIGPQKAGRRRTRGPGTPARRGGGAPPVGDARRGRNRDHRLCGPRRLICAVGVSSRRVGGKLGRGHPRRHPVAARAPASRHRGDRRHCAGVVPAPRCARSIAQKGRSGWRRTTPVSGVMIRAGAARHLMTIWWAKVSPSLTVISSNPSIFAMSKKLKVSSTLYSRKMGVVRADAVNVASRARAR